MTDPKLRAQALLARMTLSEKAAQMMQIPANQYSDAEAEAWAARGVGSFLHTLGERAERLQKVAQQSRLGIPLLFGIDAVRGHALKNGATVFPSPLAMACAWDRDAYAGRRPRRPAAEVAAGRAALDVCAAFMRRRATCAGAGWTRPSANPRC